MDKHVNRHFANEDVRMVFLSPGKEARHPRAVYSRRRRGRAPLLRKWNLGLHKMSFASAFTEVSP